MDDTAQSSSAKPIQQDDQQGSPATQQQTTTQTVPVSGGRPEQGAFAGSSVREATPVDAQVQQPDEVSGVADIQKESTDIQVQESQPAVELSQEVRDAGVQEGEDAAKQSKPEEQLQTGSKADYQTVVGAQPPFTISVPEEQAKADQQKSGIRDSLKWFASLVLYQWKKFHRIEKEEEKK